MPHQRFLKYFVALTLLFLWNHNTLLIETFKPDEALRLERYFVQDVMHSLWYFRSWNAKVMQKGVI